MHHHFSEWLVVTRVLSEDKVKFNIVDLIGSLSLESLQNYGVLFLGDAELEVVKDGTESSEVNETRPALILVLEVRLDQYSAVFDIDSEALKTCMQDSLLSII